MRPQQFVSVYLNEDVASSGGAPTPIFTEARFRARKASPVTVTNGGGTSIVWDTIIEQLNMSEKTTFIFAQQIWQSFAGVCNN